MPIDASIALQGRSPVYEPLEVAAERQLTLRNLVQRQQLGAQQIESGQLGLEAARRDAASDIAGRALFNPTSAAGTPAAAADDNPQIVAPPIPGVPGGGGPTVVPRTGGVVAPAGAPMPTDAQILGAYGPMKGSAIVKGMNDAKEAREKLIETQGKNRTAEADYLGSVLAPVKEANYDPEVFDRQVKVLELGGHAAEAKTLRDFAAQHQDNPKGIVDSALAASPEQTKLATERMTAKARADTAATGQKKADAELPALQADAALKQHRLDVIQNAKPEALLALADQIAPPGVKGNESLNARLRAQVSSAMDAGDPETAKAALANAASEMGKVELATNPNIKQNKIDIHVAEAANKAGAANAAATAGPLTPDDYKRAGAELAITGVMPALGNGSGAVKQRIIHEKMEFARQSGLGPRDMALAGAAFKGDAKSLAAFQTQRDQIVSAESTANKNLDLFINAASKIPDTGVPWANTPLRMLDQKIVGSENMAAVNAARAVATNEVAKVTAGGGLGGVLSDAAKQEVKEYNPANATFKQTLAVARILKKDMANRNSSMDATLDAIRGRVGTFGAASADAAAPSAGAATPAYKIGDTVQYQGAPHKVKAIKADGKLVLEN
jgi:hypothetical protein